MKVGVAVLDTGVYRHRDFDHRILAFRDMIGGETQPYDDSGHGTHVCGIIAGSGAASHGRYVGMAPETDLVVVKVLDANGNGKIDDVIDGLSWILANKEKYHIKVVNISFGTTTYTNGKDGEALVEMVENVWNQNIVVVAAAGNSGPEENSVTAPGISKKIITVGAYDDMLFAKSANKKDGYYSGRGPTTDCIIKPEIVVAGSNIIACTNRPDAYARKSGTSMATPIVSGAVAKVLRQQNMSPKMIKIRIKNCCERINIPDNQQGWGALNIVKFITSKDV